MLLLERKAVKTKHCLLTYQYSLSASGCFQHFVINPTFSSSPDSGDAFAAGAAAAFLSCFTHGFLSVAARMSRDLERIVTAIASLTDLQITLKSILSQSYSLNFAICLIKLTEALRFLLKSARFSSRRRFGLSDLFESGTHCACCEPALL